MLLSIGRYRGSKRGRDLKIYENSFRKDSNLKTKTEIILGGGCITIREEESVWQWFQQRRWPETFYGG